MKGRREHREHRALGSALWVPEEGSDSRPCAVDVDCSPLLELKSHHPMLDLCDSTRSQCIAVFRHQSANECLQNVVNVLGQEDLLLAQFFGVGRRQCSLVQVKFPFCGRQREAKKMPELF